MWPSDLTLLLVGEIVVHVTSQIPQKLNFRNNPIGSAASLLWIIPLPSRLFRARASAALSVRCTLQVAGQILAPAYLIVSRLKRLLFIQRRVYSFGIACRLSAEVAPYGHLVAEFCKIL